VHKLPDDTLTEEEVKRMVEVSTHPRDRALIITLYESGCRVGELLSIQIKHVSFENPVTRIIVSGKKGMRRIPLIDSTSYLAEWINSHPLRKNRNAPLWVGIGTVGRNKPLD
jgi:integrase